MPMAEAAPAIGVPAAGSPPAPARAAAKHDNVPKGLLYMVLATVMLAASNAIAKWQVATYPVGEVMFFRSLFSFLVCAAVILPFTGLSVLATRRPPDHLARGPSQAISQTFPAVAVSLMPA